MVQRIDVGLSKRLAAEFAIVVLGVLTALAVDQWVQMRADRRTEASYLQRIEADLVSDSAMLATRRSSNEEVLQRLRVLFDDSRASGPVDLSNYADDLWGLAGPTFAPAPTRSVIDELISTGGLGLIEDAEVRTSLLSYYRGWEAWTTNNAVLVETGRAPLADLGWEIGLLVPREFEPGPLLVDREQLRRALRYAASFRTVFARNLTDRLEEVERVLAVVRSAADAGIAS
jgi:type II secretory pathway pseudopilin PulG